MVLHTEWQSSFRHVIPSSMQTPLYQSVETHWNSMMVSRRILLKFSRPRANSLWHRHHRGQQQWLLQQIHFHLHKQVREHTASWPGRHKQTPGTNQCDCYLTNPFWNLAVLFTFSLNHHIQTSNREILLDGRQKKTRILPTSLFSIEIAPHSFPECTLI